MRARTILVCILGATVGIAGAQVTPDQSADAQAARENQAGPDQVIEEILVTGTRIQRNDFFSVSPIVTLDRSDIELTGTLNTADLLNDLPQVDPGPGAGTANTPFGASRINLRALGDFRTLVLLNGRRYPANSIFGSADLNALPPGIIERVEVITGGASAVYGSDAIAGAVNFILRNDFTGAEVGVQYNVTDRGDGDIFNIDAAYGTAFASGRGHLALFGNYYDRSMVDQGERSFSRTPLTSDDDTGEIVSRASIVPPAGAISNGWEFPEYTFEPDDVPRPFEDPDDRFNTSPFFALQGPMKRWSVNAFGHFDLSERTRALFEFQFTHSAPERRRSDASFSELVDLTIDRPDFSDELQTLLANDYDPDGDGLASIQLRRRFMPERGIAIKHNERDFARAVLGMDGDLGARWHWSADYSYSSTDLDMRVTNDSSVSRIGQGLLLDPVTGGCLDPSGGCVPVNPFGAGNLSAAATEFIALSGTTADEDRIQQVVDVVIRGPAAELWAGQVDAAFGFEYRRDQTDFQPGENILSGDSLFWGGNEVATSGVIEVSELFAEARVPLLRDLALARYLGLEIGVRGSDYNILDHVVWSWKLGAEWQVADGLRFRAMYQRAIRAPNVFELFQGTFEIDEFELFGLFFDQCSASRDPVANGLTELCTAQGIPEDQLGIFEAGFFPTALAASSNADLDEEKANTITAGFVWQPGWISGLSVSVDYFDIEIDDAISLVFWGDAATLCFSSRDPDNELCTFERSASGDIASGLASWYNVANAHSEGVDFALEYAWGADALGLFGNGASFGLSFIGTYYIEAGTQASPLGPFMDCAGKFGAMCSDFVFMGALPEFRSTSRLTYRSGPFTASVRWRHIGGMDNSEAEVRRIYDQPAPVLAVPEVSAVNYFDLTLDQQLGEHFNLSFGIFNIADKDPPFLGSANQDANTDPGTYDVMGRRFFFRVMARY